MAHKTATKNGLHGLRQRLRRHPFGVEAFFKRSLVLTYAVRPEALAPLLGPGLVLERYQGWSFLAIALVETENLRPRGTPRWMGRNFFLSGYRIFARLERPGGTALRGLRILRSDTDKRMMSVFGNAFTHYGYRLARINSEVDSGRWSLSVSTPNREADLQVVADLGGISAASTTLPEGSPFASMRDARRFAGPMPFTFSYDDQAQKMVVVKGVRKHWNMQPVRVEVRVASYLDGGRFAGSGAHLANAFYLQDVDYAWERGFLQESA